MSAPLRISLDELMESAINFATNTYPARRGLKLCLHFEDGECVSILFPSKRVAIGDDCECSEDFRRVTWFGKKYQLGNTQAAVFRQLWEARADGDGEVDQDALLKVAGADSPRLCDLFRRHQMWADRVIGPGSRGTYRLYAPEEM